MSAARSLTWKQKFLEELASTCNVRAACVAANIARTTAYAHRHSDVAFAEAWDDALDDALDDLESEARRRAKDGVEEPVFHLGKEVAKVRKYSDGLLMFLLKAYRPERFRDLNLEQLAEAIIRRMGSSQLPAELPEAEEKSAP